MKKWLVFLGVFIVVAPIAYYLLSPLWEVVELDEASPLDVLEQQSPGPEEHVNLEIKDEMDSMDEATKAEFEEQMEVMKDKVMVMDDAMPTTPQLVAEALFKPRAHEVEGVAKLIEVDGKKVLRFEDFNTVNGPELHIYLSSELGNDDFIDLGIIKATKGNVNYEIPEGIDTEKYSKVLVWCKPFGVLFSYADLAMS